MKKRIITAVVLIPILLVVLFAAPPVLLSILLGILCAIGAYELLFGTGMVKHPRLLVYTMLSALLVPVWCYAGTPKLLGMLGLFAFVALSFGEILISRGKLRFERIGVCMMGGLVIPFLLSAIVRLIGDGTNRTTVLIPFVLAYMADTGAYFIGSAFGKHKLAPVISPNKSIEGLVGGILTDILGMVVYCLVLQLAFGVSVNYLFAITYGIIGAFAGTFGDLCFSAIKRQSGIKDYGNLFPGHGGVLDRLDSVIITAPLTELLLALLPVLG